MLANRLFWKGLAAMLMVSAWTMGARTSSSTNRRCLDGLCFIFEDFDLQKIQIYVCSSYHTPFPVMLLIQHYIPKTRQKPISHIPSPPEQSRQLMPLSHFKTLQTMRQEQPQFKTTRNQFLLEIRKENRQRIFLKKRRARHGEEMQIESQTQIQSPIVDEQFRKLVRQLEAQKYHYEQIDQLCNSLEESSEEVRHWAVIGLRKLLSEDEGEPYLQRIIDNGTIPKLIQLINNSKYPQLQLEACWIITNIAFGSTAQCEAIVSKQGVEALLQLVYEHSGSILEQALWGLGNIAGDSTFCRDTVIMKGGVQCISRVVQNSNNNTAVQLGCWALSNICRGDTPPKYQLIKIALPVLATSIVEGNLHDQYLSSCLWALALHSEGSKSKVRYLLKVQLLVPRLIEICYSDNVDLLVPGLRTIGNISTGSEAQTNELLKNNVLDLLRKLLDHKKRSVRRQACWTISNICAGPLNQIQKCIYFPNLIPKLMNMFVVDQHDIRREICFIMANMCHLGNPEEIYNIVKEYHVLPALAALLQQDDDIGTIETALNCLYELLGIGAKVHQKNAVLAELSIIPGLFDRLQSLQMHTSQGIYKQLSKILQRYFTLEENDF